MRSLQDEVLLLGRQAAATTRLVKSLDQQLWTINAEVDTANKRVDAAQAAAARHDIATVRTGDEVSLPVAVMSAGDGGPNRPGATPGLR